MKQTAQAQPIVMPDSAEEALQRGNSLRAKGRHNPAIAILKDSMARFPDSAVADKIKITLAVCLLKKNRQDEAAALYQDVLTRDGGNKYAHGGLAGIYFKQGHHDKARDHAQKLLASDPQQFYGLYYMTKIAVATDRMDEARAMFKRFHDAHSTNPKSVKLVIEAENLVYPHKVYPAAPPPPVVVAPPVPGTTVSPEELVASFRAAGLKAKDPSVRQREFAAVHRHDAGTRPAALPTDLSPVQQMELRIARNPRDVGAYQVLANLLLRENRTEEAMTRLREVLTIDTKNSPARQLLQKLEAATKPPQEPGFIPA